MMIKIVSMQPFQKTSIYKEALALVNEINSALNSFKSQSLKEKINTEINNIVFSLAKILPKFRTRDPKEELVFIAENILGIIALLDVARGRQEITEAERLKLSKKLEDLKKNILYFREKQKKILIFTSNFGQGHNAAAKGIAEGIAYEYGFDYSVEIVDFVELLGSLFNKVSTSGYKSAVKFAPNFYKFLFKSTNKYAEIIKLMNQLNYTLVRKKIKKYFEEKKADILISTFPYWDATAAEIWKEYKSDGIFISIVTDSITIHSCYFIKEADYYFVANEDTKEAIQKCKFNRDKIMNFGFPVSLKFIEKTNKKDILEKLEMDPDKFTVLFLPTSQIIKKNKKIIGDIIAENDDINIIIITGREVKSKPKFDQMASRYRNTKVIGWTDQMAEFIKTADLVITKAGGATIQECIASKTPMLITSVIPGQEEGNAQIIRKYDLGIIADKKGENIGRHVAEMRNNLQKFIKNIEKISNPRASIDIAKFIHKILQKEEPIKIL
jgi:processive 1,2-diacylglycerol beta-glucosyltransferase